MTSASLVAPADVAHAIDDFGRAIQQFLDVVGQHNPTVNPIDRDAFVQAARPAAKAQLALLNTIRRSLGGSLGELTFYLGGSLVGQDP